eukprot:CFRG1837T1
MLSAKGKHQIPVIHYVTSVEQAQEVFCESELASTSVVAVDTERCIHPDGREVIALVQVGGLRNNKTVLYDTWTCPKILSCDTTLRKMLTSSEIVKVFHDGRLDSLFMREQFRIKIDNLYDIQTAHMVLRGTCHREAMNNVVEHWVGMKNTVKENVRHTPTAWATRPLPQVYKDYAAQDVQFSVQVYNAQREESKKSKGNWKLCKTSHVDMLQKETTPIRTVLKPKLNRSLIVQNFYNMLETADDDVRQRYQDRKLFTIKFREWKDSEQKKYPGNRLCVSPSTALSILRRKRRAQVLEDDVIIYPMLLADLTVSNKQAKNPLNNTAYLETKNRIAVQKVVYAVHQSRRELEKDKQGIHMGPMTFGGVIAPGSSKSCVVDVVNTHPSNEYKLLRYEFHSKQQNSPFTIDTEMPILLGRGILNTTVVLSCRARTSGLYRDLVSFTFMNLGTNDSITICRFVEARFGSADLLEFLGATSTFNKKLFLQNKAKQRDGWKNEPVEAAPQEHNGIGTRYIHRLNAYRLPVTWTNKSDNDITDALQETLHCFSSETEGCTDITHTKHMQWYVSQQSALLFAEEIKQIEDLHNFDIQGTKLERQGKLLKLLVPGLAENRPSVLRGDKILVRFNDKQWEGKVEKCNLDDIEINMYKMASYYVPGMKCDVRFVANRSVLRIMHQGINMASNIEKIILPTANPRMHMNNVTTSDVNFHNNYLNLEQKNAVRNILSVKCRPSPYVIFGPPGTGKTTAIVEAIKQLAREYNMRILVTAPTNVACDVITKRLGIFSNREMFRNMAFNRSKSAVGIDIDKYCHWDDEKYGYTPPNLDTVKSFKVVVSTLISAAKLYNLGVDRGHFDVIFVDESGQAVEAEVMASLAPFVNPDKTLVVLAGDPYQLGPVLHSKDAAEHGLGLSYLERLMKLPQYARVKQVNINVKNDDGGKPAAHLSPYYDPKYITKLVNNYRSHPHLLEVPNRLFYDNELIACEDLRQSGCFLGWDALPNPSLPMIFHGVVGKDQREANSPSWFNADECVIVLDYVKNILDFKRTGTKPSDIGIITPYAKQRQKLERLLQKEKLGEVKVGTTEMFQGQEKRVIVISCTRSSADYVTSDKKYNIGFLSNPKRFNVSTTRAKSLMVVVGNPFVLSSDPSWGTLLDTCRTNGTYTGIEYPDVHNGDVDGTIARLEKLVISDSAVCLDADKTEKRDRLAETGTTVRYEE